MNLLIITGIVKYLKKNIKKLYIFFWAKKCFKISNIIYKFIFFLNMNNYKSLIILEKLLKIFLLYLSKKFFKVCRNFY